MPFTHVAFLRGINVGGKNLLPMKDLARIFSEAGCDDVRTYIQSGNVLFDAAPHVCVGLHKTVATQIAEQFGYRTPVVVRSMEQLRSVIHNNPLLPDGTDEAILHVMFLADLPSPEHISALDAGRSPSDTFFVHGQEIHLRLPNGVARTKLTNAYFDSKLATVSTSRSWQTVTKLLELVSK